MRAAPTRLLLIGLLFCAACAAPAKHDDGVTTPKTLLDLSGLTWVEDDLFLGIHDAKDNPEKHDWPRASFLRLPTSELEGVKWTVIPLEFPGAAGRGSDLESACRIPGNRGFLICESGQEGEQDRRIFHAVRDGDGLTIDSYTNWPVAIKNVEGTEVCEVGGELVFMYAERADGQPSTMFRWAPLSLNPLGIGEFRQLEYKGVDPVGDGARPIVGLDVDSNGWIYSVSAYDSGVDDGPYRSVVWRIGRVTADAAGRPQVTLGQAKRLATLDSLKVESVTVRETGDGKLQVFVGTDDEHYGGIMRLLPDRP